MEILKYISVAVYIVVCILLIFIVSIQNKNSKGASGSIVGGTSSNFYEKNKGRTKEGKMKKFTISLGVAFAVLSILVGILYLI